MRWCQQIGCWLIIGLVRCSKRFACSAGNRFVSQAELARHLFGSFLAAALFNTGQFGKLSVRTGCANAE